jgi:prevent-host-death family protein
MSKNIEIGAYEAKTHLPRLLREVAEGQSFTITLRGKPVAELKPTHVRPRRTHEEAVRAMIEFTKREDRPSLTAEQIKEMIEYGRR